MSELRTYPNAEELITAAADAFVEFAEYFIDERGHFTVCLSGGSTPKAMFELLASEDYASKVEWDKVHVFWGDERTVPPDHADSNYRMAYEALLKYVPIPETQIHRMEAEIDLEEAVANYTQIMRPPLLGSHIPIFNLIWLGMGEDGHTASLFPFTPAVHEKEAWVVAQHIEKLDTWRMTLTPPVINAAEYVIFLIAGKTKAEIFQKVLQGTQKISLYPAQVVAPTSGKLIWMVDEAVAANLHR